MPTTKSRTVHIYDVTAWCNNPGQGNLALVPDMTAVFAGLHALPASNAAPPASTRYLTLDDGNQLYMDFRPSDAARKVYGRFGYKRCVGLDLLEKTGAYRDVPLDAENGEGQAALRHFVFDLDCNRLAIVPNGMSAGISRWCSYIPTRVPGRVEKVEAVMVVDPALLARLQRVSRIRGASVTVRRDHIEMFDDLDSRVKRALLAASEASDAVELTISWEVGSRTHDAEVEIPWKNRIPGFVDAHRSEIEAFALRAFDPALGSTEPIDLLENHIHGRVLAHFDDAGEVDAAELFLEIDRVLSEVNAAVPRRASAP